MPLVRIDVPQGLSSEQLRAISDGVHRALVEAAGVPALDRFHVVSEHAPGRLIVDPEYLGIHRSAGAVVVQITLNMGRTLDQKRALYAAIARNLVANPGVRTEDILVSLVEVVKENWSFGNGVAQYAS
ncbi:MAG: tautomerase family protein [Thermoanaerobaculia bacterium]